MKLHGTLINKLITLYEVNSGWREQSKLRKALANLNIMTYTQQTGEEVLVDGDELDRKLREMKTPEQ